MTPEASQPTTPTTPAMRFGPKRDRNLWFACICGVIGLLETWMFVDKGNGPLILLLAGIATTLMAVIFAVASFRNVPQLTIDADGYELRLLFKTKRARWKDLGPFSIVETKINGTTIRQAVAPFIHEDGTRRSRAVIPDGLEAPLQQIMAEIRRIAVIDPASPRAPTKKPAQMMGVPGFRLPWLTAAMLAAFAGVFYLEQSLAITPGDGLAPSLRTLVALGGLNNRLVVEHNQLFRILAAPMLHGSFRHLVQNSVAFALAGYCIERLLGRAWLLSIFGTGAIAGSLASVIFSSPTTVSVGASGAIMAMLLCLITVSFRMPDGRMKRVTQIEAMQIAVPALIPFGHQTGGTAIDYGAHIGGAIAGLIIGLLLARTWRDNSPLPRFRWTATAIAVLVFLAFAAASRAEVSWYQETVWRAHIR